VPADAVGWVSLWADVVSADPRPESGPAARADAFLARHGRALLLVAAAAMLAVLAAWGIAKSTDLLPPATEAYRAHAYQEHHGPLRDLALVIVRLADAGVAFATVAALATSSWVRGGPRAALLPVAAAAVVVVTTIAKHLPGRVTTLPSGHAAYAMAAGGYAAWLLLRAGRPWAAACVLVVALAMAPARVVEGAHRPADVLAGVALGTAWTVVVLVVGRPWAARAAAP
jgi:membrane-associated phospholipid phosphatase